MKLACVMVAAGLLAMAGSASAAQRPVAGFETGSALHLIAKPGAWQCVKKGPCWTACRGDLCRRACFRSGRDCRRSLR